MKERLKLIPLIWVVASLVVAGYCMLTYEDDYLWKVQELNLFLDTPLFFKQQMVVPGGLLTWMGTYLTDFFYHSWMGVSLLCGCWGVLILLLAMAFRVSAKWLTVLLIPVALLLLTNMELGYWIYYMKLRGYFFVASLGLTAATAAVWCYRLLPSMLRIGWLVVSGLALYPLAGVYGLLAVVLMGILSWRLPDMPLKLRIVHSATALVLVLAVPLGCYWWLYYQTNSAELYLAALPMFSQDADYPVYYWPFALLGIFYVLAAAFYRVEPGRVLGKPLVCIVSQLALLAVLCLGVYHFWYKDYNFHQELKMQRAMEQYDWDGVLAAAANQQDEPTRAIVMMKNLALFREGRLGNEMYHFRNGAKPSDTPLTLRMTQVVGRGLYYQYGLLNYCYRWCLEDGVEFGWRVEYLKYMTRCALLNGEYRVAAKYIGILRHTRYHREWAEQLSRYLHHPGLVEADAHFAPIVHLMGYDDHLGSDNGLVEYFLMTHLLNNDTIDPQLQELTLVAALWMKDISVFWPRFYNYAMLHPNEPMPVHYQEAAYLYGHLENKVDISRLPFDQSVVQCYDQFMELANQCRGMTEEQMRPIFYNKYSSTFYYDYFLVRNQKLY